MKKLLLLLLFVTISLSSYSQARLKATYGQILTEFDQLEPQAHTLNDGTKVLTFKAYGLLVVYYFNSNYICDLTVISTKSDKIAKEYIDTYNNTYIVIDKGKWKIISEEGNVAYILSRYDKDLGYVFSWVLE